MGKEGYQEYYDMVRDIVPVFTKYAAERAFGKIQASTRSELVTAMELLCN